MIYNTDHVMDINTYTCTEGHIARPVYLPYFPSILQFGEMTKSRHDDKQDDQDDDDDEADGNPPPPPPPKHFHFCSRVCFSVLFVSLLDCEKQFGPLHPLPPLALWANFHRQRSLSS